MVVVVVVVMSVSASLVDEKSGLYVLLLLWVVDKQQRLVIGSGGCGVLVCLGKGDHVNYSKYSTVCQHHYTYMHTANQSFPLPLHTL